MRQSGISHMTVTRLHKLKEIHGLTKDARMVVVYSTREAMHLVSLPIQSFFLPFLLRDSAPPWRETPSPPFSPLSGRIESYSISNVDCRLLENVLYWVKISKEDGVMTRSFSVILLLLLSAACGPVPSTPTPDQLSTVVAQTLTAVASQPVPATDTPSPSTTASPTSEPFSAPFVLTSAQNVNLRTRPGLLFPVSRVMAQGTRLQVIGRAPGGDWLNVMTDESIIGWVQVNFVQGGGYDGPPPPIVEPGDVQKISGRVTDAAGQPVSGIGFAVTQGSAPNAPRTDATTDETGTFYAFRQRDLDHRLHLNRLHQQQDGCKLRLPGRRLRRTSPGKPAHHPAGHRSVYIYLGMSSGIRRKPFPGGRDGAVGCSA
jgi:hypothetical protein